MYPKADIRYDEATLAATDPKQPFVVSLQADLFPLNVGAVHAISLSRYQA